MFRTFRVFRWSRRSERVVWANLRPENQLIRVG